MSAPHGHLRRSPELAWVAVAVFAALAWGGAAGPHPWDVGELAVAAARLGGSHAPGQPLHALLGHASGWLPLGSYVARLSWLSALGAAIAAYAAGQTVRALSGRDDPSTRIGAALAAIALVLTPAVLRSAMRPEVYALALACTMLGAWALAERARGFVHGLRVTAVLAALALALHPPHALALAAVALVACAAKRPSRVELGSSIALGLVVSVALVAYLPIRGAAGAPCWGEPTSAAGLWAYVSGAAYQRNLGTQQRDALAVARYLVLDGGGLPLVLGLVAVRERALRLPWGMALVAVVAALLQPFEERNPDNVAYDAPALALGLVAAATTLAELARRAPRLGIAALLLPMAPLWASLDGGHLGGADVPVLETFAFETLGAPGPRALLVTRTDFVAASAMLGREVDGDRPDVAHFVSGLATSSWHWRSLAGHPAFDGAPHRGEGSDPRVAYVRGALGRARGHVEIDVEDATLLDETGVMVGALLHTTDRPIDRYGIDGPPTQLRSPQATAERTMEVLLAAVRGPPLGDHEAASQILRDVIVRRATLLVTRGEAERARHELVAAAPDAGAAIAALDDGPFVHGGARWIRDPAWFMASRGDVVRAIAVLLDRRGHPEDATTLLRAQAEAGEDLAIAQLAAIELADGLLAAARTSYDAFRARRPGLRSPALDALSHDLRD